ncbi:MAG: DUF4349 domain-containing protein [Butyricicoccaceae bacterium]
MKRQSARILSMMLALLMLSVLTACGASDSAKSETGGSMSFDNSTSMEYDTPMEMGMSESQTEAGEALSQRKIIYTYSAELQTLEFDQTLEQIENAAAQAGGYIEQSSRTGSGAVDYGRVYARTASYTLRIPAAAAGDFVQGLSAWASVTQSSKGTDDVTDYYYDSEARLNNLRVQETRLLELLAQAESMADMITIEQALSDVRYEIESIDGTLRRLDNQVDYSRVELYIEEVFEPDQLRQAPLSLGERIAARFRSSLVTIQDTVSDLIVFLLGDSLLLVFWAAVLAMIVIIAKKIYKKLGKKHENIEPDKK